MEITVRELLFKLQQADKDAIVYIHTPHNHKDMEIIDIKASKNEVEIQVE